MKPEIFIRMQVEVGATERQISAVEKLLSEGCTVPSMGCCHFFFYIQKIGQRDLTPYIRNVYFDHVDLSSFLA